MMESTQSNTYNDPMRTAWRRSRPGLAVVGVLSMFINMLRFATPIYILQILDRVIGSGSFETLTVLTIIVVIAVTFNVLMSVARKLLLIAWGNWIMRFFGPLLFSAGLSEDAYQNSKVTGALRDAKTIRRFVASDGLAAWLDVIWAPVFIAVVFFIAVPLGYIVLTGCVMVVILGALNELLSRQSRGATFQAGKESQDWIDAAERHHETVSSLNIIRNLANRWSASASNRLDERTTVQTTHIYFSSAIYAIGRFIRIGIFCTGVWMVLNEEITIGPVIAASILGLSAFSTIQKAMSKWRDMINAKIAYERIKKAVRQDDSGHISVPDAEHSAPLILDNVTYIYMQPKVNWLFREMSITVNPGEALLVIGHSAAGKTTFARLVSGLVKPRSGQIRLGAVSVSRLHQNSLFHGIGTLLQDTALFNGTARENIAGMAAGNLDEVIKAAKLAGVHETILALPQAYDTELSEYEPLLSSGQRKAITLARAFYGTPQLVILDEPEPHLDRSMRSALFNAIEYLKSQGSIVVVTSQSRLSSIRADKVIMLGKTSRHRILTDAEEISALHAKRKRTHKRRPKRIRSKTGVKEPMS